jgi:hypothetical protein
MLNFEPQFWQKAAALHGRPKLGYERRRNDISGTR